MEATQLPWAFYLHYCVLRKSNSNVRFSKRKIDMKVWLFMQEALELTQFAKRYLGIGVPGGGWEDYLGV
jgi:hypothetical protein